MTDKFAGLPLAARLAASVLGYAGMRSDQKHQGELMQEAEMMNQLAREAEARRMAPVVNGLQRNTELAEKMGAYMAKEAFGAALAGLGKMVAGGAGKVMGALKPAASKAVNAVKPGFKTKALGAAAIAGTGYVGYKGLQGARDYMMMPPGQGQQFGVGPKASVNEFGY